jgi:hypothetical protein
VLKRVLIAVVLSIGIVVGVLMLPSGVGEVGFDGGTAFITLTVVGTKGERIVLDKQVPLTQSLMYEGIEIAYFEYVLEVEFDGSVDVAISASKVSALLNCDISCIVAKEWGILSQSVRPGERHEIASVNISASTFQNIAPSGEFQLKFVLSLEWQPLEAGGDFMFVDVTYPILRLQKVSDDPIVAPPDDPIVAPPGGGGYYILAVSFTPIVEER